ncbi:helix-turn-helix domain-containing protein [Rickettsia helvetica]|uniref:HTH cro/C1-type domain-containing protein n=1 Tax=Rickettsia helvetica TaxID=35789 RepID=A0ABM9NAC7_RICHE|nr:helix-turn-helix transcriptional regulator [Rickettsia helvetica]MCZ6884485.1 helix-turn-helix transcriptional regulator [Rickettsia endosymbiont of Ixodes ricinus]
MSEDIRSKERFNRINDISETNKDGPEEIRNNFKKFVLNILETDNITPYKLSEKTGTHETAWKNFLDGRTKMPDMGAIVALADYKNVPLDEVIGRDINKEKKTMVEIKQTPEISASITKLPKDILQEAMLIGEKTRGFMHKPTTKETKSFAEQVKSSNKPKGRSI